MTSQAHEDILDLVPTLPGRVATGGFLSELLPDLAQVEASPVEGGGQHEEGCVPRAARSHPSVLDRHLNKDRATVCPKVLVPSGQGIVDRLELDADSMILADRLSSWMGRWDPGVSLGVKLPPKPT
jgi:hypothetical protein